MAERLVPYVQEMGFTHVEFMPIAEYPFGGSWGYQPLGLFAPTGRYGDAEDFAYLVDRCHAAGIGVIVDWVPAHFPTDVWGLARFDGTALYEHADPREGYHPDWNTLIYNLGRKEVKAFLIASALEWIERYHVDALRVDAVASMLYRDYSRRDGEWIPNRNGGRENLESVEFFRHLNSVIAARAPGVLTIAEESTAWPGVTARPEQGGLGFSLKWNMGWMHDTLHYMEKDPVYRRHHHGMMTFAMVYAYSERFVLPLSHDEVVHGKGSLIAKMPGDHWQRFANLRAYPRLDVGVSRQEAPLHGRRNRAMERMERRWLDRMGLDRPPASSRRPDARRRSQPGLCLGAGTPCDGQRAWVLPLDRGR